MTANRLKHIAPKISKNVNAKILILDVECSPSLGYVWGMFKQTLSLGQLVEQGEMISFAARWYGEKDIIFKSNYHDGHDEMVRACWQLVDECDYLVGYNSANFDGKIMAREFVLAGMAPPSPYKDIDLLRVVRSRFRFVSNKLQNVCDELGLPVKVETGGFQLWVDCMANDAKAWATMKRYNENDVRITEKLFDRLRPWLTGIHLGQFVNEDAAGNVAACPNCGSDQIEQYTDRTYKANIQTYAAMRCKKCGTPMRGTSKKREPITTRAVK